MELKVVLLPAYVFILILIYADKFALFSNYFVIFYKKKLFAVSV